MITQHNDVNAGLLAEPVEHDNHHVLVDASGGRGRLPETWERPDTPKRVGFAGGLSPENLEIELPRILAVARAGDWIDMETGVRTDDWLDLGKVRRVLEIASA